LRFFRWYGKERSAVLTHTCSDLGKPYLKVIARKACAAVHVLDCFHIRKYFSNALDEVRAGETKCSRRGP